MLRALGRDFSLWAHPHQRPPPGDWSTWLMIGGRGAGKTRAGAEWIRAQALGLRPFAAAPVGRLALVGETAQDAREVMVEGVAGLLAIHPRDERPLFTPSRRRLEWPNGAVAELFSAEDPDQLRGPQFAVAWCDELAKWHRPEAAFDMLAFALRLGPHPRRIVTTTPRPIALIRRLLADPSTAVTRAPTHANAAHLSPAFLAEIERRYAGTRLGRQEIGGEIVEDLPGALFPRAMIEAARATPPGDYARLVVAVDPPATPRGTCGIIVAGRAADGRLWVLADRSAGGLGPAGWARRAVETARAFEADALVCEVNQGGDMVAAVVRQVDPDIRIVEARASRGKWLRAEPVAALYEQGRVRHAATFPALEDEMVTFTPEGRARPGEGGATSPDRLDALVWALTELAREGPQPRIRAL